MMHRSMLRLTSLYEAFLVLGGVSGFELEFRSPDVKFEIRAEPDEVVELWLDDELVDADDTDANGQAVVNGVIPESGEHTFEVRRVAQQVVRESTTFLIRRC